MCNDDQSIFLQTKEFVVLFNSQPKSKLHLLLLPRTSFLHVKNSQELSPNHFEKLKRLHSAANIIVDFILRHTISSNDLLRSVGNNSIDALVSKLSLPTYETDNLQVSPRILMGYHARPSFEPLHMHILTDDFDSIWLKTRRQWNTFNTAYFLDCASIEEWLTSGYTIGDLLPEDLQEFEIYLSQKIRCLHCRKAMKDIRTLKAHLKAFHCQALQHQHI